MKNKTRPKLVIKRKGGPQAISLVGNRGGSRHTYIAADLPEDPTREERAAAIEAVLQEFGSQRRRVVRIKGE